MSNQQLQPVGVSLEAGRPASGAAELGKLVMPAKQSAYLLPVALFMVLCLLTVVLWRAELRHERQNIESKIAVTLLQLSRRVQQALDDRTRPLRRMARQRLSGDLETAEEFAVAARLVEAQLPPYRSIWLVTDPQKESPAVAAVYERAANEEEASNLRGSMVEMPQSAEVLIGVPAVQMRPTRSLLGVVVGQLRLAPLLEQIVDTAQSEPFQIVLRGSGEQVLYQTGEAAPGWEGDREPLMVLGVQWWMWVRPSADFIAANTSRAPWLTLWGGLVLSLLISLGAEQWSVLRRRRERETRSHLEALERLSELSAAINAKLGSGPEVIDQLARSACDLMGMNAAIVGIADSAQQRLSIMATVGVHSLELGEYRLEAAPGVRHCLQAGQIVKVEDAERVAGLVNAEEMRRIGMRSMLELPLWIESRVIGLLIVGDTQPRTINEAQVHLARLLANQAAVILANHRLYEQMDEAITVQRRDAEARAVLLRELNHRVKNSLAGIVSLLSVGEPEMPAQARQWLGRVIERIRNMARTHELLSGGMQTIALRELVGQMLPSLTVVKPPGVRICTEVGGVEVVLGTERAVGLAMVLHELCYNAIVHGSGPEGLITIRARAVSEGRVAVEVIDEGGGRDGVEGESTPRGSGMGLTLVRGLVSRELQGEFSLCGRAAGGSVATVEFPLQPDEMDDVSI